MAGQDETTTMAKMFYTPAEAAAKLGKTEDELTDLVKAGKLREFQDAGSVAYKIEDIDKLAPADAVDTGGIVLEPADESDIVLAAPTDDELTLEAAEDDAEGTKTPDRSKKDKEGTVVNSVGVSVFDDDELDEVVDPLAQTAISDVGDLGLEGAGSGSGILDLTRESDDTSLGAELLDEIYTGEEEATVEMGDDTRAGIVETGDEPTTEDDDEIFEGATPAAVRTTTVRVMEYAPDALSTGLTAGMVVAVLTMLLAGVAGAGMVADVVPGIVATLNENLMYVAGGSFLLAALATIITFFVAKR